MKLTVHLEGKTKADLAKGLKAHLALFESGEETDAIDVSTLGKKGKKKPLKTVDADEDEDFGSSELSEDDLDDEEEDEAPAKKTKSKKSTKDTDADESEDEDEDTDSDESEDESDEDDEPSVSFQDVRAALNKYGEKHPDQARAILSTFNIKSPKELAAKHNEKYWEPVYRKVMAKIKAAKKKK